MTTSTLTGPFCCNHQYSVTAITTSTGAIAERYAYTAYGQPTILNASGTPLSPQTSTLNSRYSYTGREWDATLGLHHFRARWMSPSAGRFLSRDPIGYVDSASVYSYVVSKPMSLVDPSGLVSITCTCMKYIRFPGEPAQQQIFTTEIECNELAASCCGTACKEQGGVFTGSWKQTDAEDDEVFSDEEVVDILDQSICNVFIVCDALPVTGGPTGECIPLCAGTKICCRAVKTCFKKKYKRKRMRSCVCFSAGTWRDPDWSEFYKAGKGPCRGQNGNTSCNNHCKSKGHKFGLCVWL
jgi:RHS repeat-associated protein